MFVYIPHTLGIDGYSRKTKAALLKIIGWFGRLLVEQSQSAPNKSQAKPRFLWSSGNLLQKNGDSLALCMAKP